MIDLLLLLFQHHAVGFKDAALVLSEVRIDALLDDLRRRAQALIQLRVQEAVLLQVLGESQLVLDGL